MTQPENESTDGSMTNKLEPSKMDGDTGSRAPNLAGSMMLVVPIRGMIRVSVGGNLFSKSVTAKQLLQMSQRFLEAGLETMKEEVEPHDN